MDTEKEKEYFLVSVRNLFTLADKQYCPKFSAFMTEEDQALAQPLAAKLSRNTGMEIRFWGGYEGAVRVMLGVFPEGFPVETEDFPIVGYTARCRASDKLEHRALLGSLMAQQIRREMLGDLIPGTGSAVISPMNGLKRCWQPRSTGLGQSASGWKRVLNRLIHLKDLLRFGEH